MRVFLPFGKGDQQATAVVILEENQEQHPGVVEGASAADKNQEAFTEEPHVGKRAAAVAKAKDPEPEEEGDDDATATAPVPQDSGEELATPTVFVDSASPSAVLDYQKSAARKRIRVSASYEPRRAPSEVAAPLLPPPPTQVTSSAAQAEETKSEAPAPTMVAGPPRKHDDEQREEAPSPQPFENAPPAAHNNNYRNNISISYKKSGDDDEDEDPLLEFSVSSEPGASVYSQSHSSTARAAAAATDTNNSRTFVQRLQKRGLDMVPQEGDGNCLFRAVALQVYGDAAMHGDVRHQVMDLMARDPAHFGPFIVDSDTHETFAQYVARKRQDGVHGNHVEIQAMSELFNRPVEVYADDEDDGGPMNIFHAEYKTDNLPIRLSYHDGNHYNAVVDPLVPTAGLGLGMPGLQPGLADKLQLSQAVVASDQLADEMELKKVLQESSMQTTTKARLKVGDDDEDDDDDLQRALKESMYAAGNVHHHHAMTLSDVDATNVELEQVILCESMETMRQDQERKKPSALSPPTSEAAALRRPLPPPTPYIASPVAAAAAASSPAAAAAARPATPPPPTGPLSVDEYPATVQELVMNGFELRKVVHAYELVGDSFDDLLAFLMTNTAS